MKSSKFGLFSTSSRQSKIESGDRKIIQNTSLLSSSWDALWFLFTLTTLFCTFIKRNLYSNFWRNLGWPLNRGSLCTYLSAVCFYNLPKCILLHDVCTESPLIRRLPPFLKGVKIRQLLHVRFAASKAKLLHFVVQRTKRSRLWWHKALCVYVSTKDSLQREQDPEFELRSVEHKLTIHRSSCLLCVGRSYMYKLLLAAHQVSWKRLSLHVKSLRISKLMSLSTYIVLKGNI